MSRPGLQVPLLIAPTLALIFLLGCASAPKQSSDSTTEPIVSSTPPFQTKEPERYQAVRTITFGSTTGEAATVKTIIAKDGQLRRDEHGRVIYLETDQGPFVILTEQKIYAALGAEPEATDQGFPTEDSPERLLNTETVASRYQKVGTEVLNGRSTTKYQTVNTSTRGTVSNSETLIWIDDELGMPIKATTTSADGRNTTMELTGISLEVDRRLFQLPEGYQKVSVSLIRQRLSGK
jgi:outer membrane lipoprotein-sorting protein